MLFKGLKIIKYLIKLNLQQSVTKLGKICLIKGDYKTMNKELFLSPSDIIKNFLSYLDNTKYNYAYMIDGSWGSGKTFFIKEKLIPEIESHEELKGKNNTCYKEKKVLYVSLYGVKDTDDISRLLYLELRKAFTETVAKGTILGKIRRKKEKIISYAGTGAKFVSDIIKGINGIDLISILDKISERISLKNCILIFDDLERTGCNINDVLGYINNFVEHDGIKVLLVANEDEINTVTHMDVNPDELLVCLQDNLDFEFLEESKGDKDKVSPEELTKRANVLFACNQAYKQIKEKVVGETVKYQPDYLTLIKILTNKNLENNKTLKNIINSKLNIIREIAIHYNHLNLRTFLFFLSKITTLANCLQEHEKTLEELVDYVFLISIRFKMGYKIEEWDKSTLFMIKPLYDVFDFRNRCLAFKFIDDFILFSKLDIKQVEEAVTLYEKYKIENAENENDPINKLHNWMNMDEKTVRKLIKEVLLKMEEGRYSFDTYLDILNCFVSLIYIGFEESYLSDLIKYMIDNINKATEKVRLRLHYAVTINAESDRIYAEESKKLMRVSEKKNISLSEDELSSLLLDKDSWGIKLKEYIYNHKNIGTNSVISKINANTIIKLIKDSNSENIDSFRYALKDLYSFDNIADYYMEDYDNLKIIYDGLDIDNLHCDLIKRKNIEWLKKDIGEKMNLLMPKV